MLDYHDALAQLLAALHPVTDAQTVPLPQAAGRVLAVDVSARCDTPLFDNAAMDGYAIAAHAPDAGADTNIQDYHLDGLIAAGDTRHTPLKPGQAVRIFTGAPCPPGTTAVVMQEEVHEQGGVLHVPHPVTAGAHIRRRAEEVAAGGVLMRAGHVLDAAAIAQVASQGYVSLPVLRPLRVTVFSSGNELCEPGQPLSDGQIYDANRYQLLAWLAGMGASVCASDGGILPDNASATRARLLEAARSADVVLTSGGVSVGEADHVRSALESIGTLHVWKLAIKPGKPFAWGQAQSAQVLMLPGNPVATFVTFHQLVLPALRKLCGHAQAMPTVAHGVAAFARSKAQARREFLRARVHADATGVWRIAALAGQGSAMLTACVQANALVEIPPHHTVEPGQTLAFYPLPKGVLP